MTNLTEHFTLDEFTESQTATRKGIANKPSAAEINNLRRVAEVLEQVRALYGRPLTISSGYRSAALNAAVGGSKTSAHLRGLAADINVPGVSPRDLALKIRDSGIPFDQLIHEGTWVHIGLADGAPRREVLTAHFGSGPTSYTHGIS